MLPLQVSRRLQPRELSSFLLQPSPNSLCLILQIPADYPHPPMACLFGIVCSKAIVPRVRTRPAVQLIQQAQVSLGGLERPNSAVRKALISANPFPLNRFNPPHYVS